MRDLEERIEQIFQKKLNAISEVTSRRWNNGRKTGTDTGRHVEDTEDDSATDKKE